VAIVSSLNRAYDIDEGRPWWKVRLTAIGLTIALAVLGLLSFTLVVVGPTIAERIADAFGLGSAFEWSWKVLQWPLAFFLVSSAVGLVYYFAPDAEQDWVWITPGAVAGTLLWFLASLAFKFYVARFGDYNAAYGAVGAVIVLMLWFYISGLAILVGAELNAEIEHASPYGKAPGEKVPGQKKKIGLAAARAFKERLERQPPPTIQPEIPKAEVIMETNRDDRSLGDMIADLSREVRTLLQQEIQLAKTELTEKAAKLTRSAAVIVIGGFVAYGGLLAIIAAVVLGLVAAGLPGAVAALIGGVIVALAGYVLVRSGLKALNLKELKPSQTIESLKEDAQWLRTQTK
jgi:Virulence factor BrkB/Putative Actinobacterial Holin-X, holin superfamily III